MTPPPPGPAPGMWNVALSSTIYTHLWTIVDPLLLPFYLCIICRQSGSR
jgi:hypothetical protein